MCQEPLPVVVIGGDCGGDSGYVLVETVRIVQWNSA